MTLALFFFDRIEEMIDWVFEERAKGALKEKEEDDDSIEFPRSLFRFRLRQRLSMGFCLLSDS